MTCAIMKGVRVPWRDVITPAQIRMLAAIQHYRDEHGYAPTLRELGQKLGIVSANGVRSLLQPLKRKGLLTDVPGQYRTLVPLYRIEEVTHAKTTKE